MSASKWPTGVDGFTDPSSSTPMNNSSQSHSAMHTLANDAVVALQQSVGVAGGIAGLGSATKRAPGGTNAPAISLDTAANWTAANPVLGASEVAVETDTGNVKVGNGTAAYAALGSVLSGIYVAPPSMLKLGAFHAALADRAQGRCSVAVIGDSITEGSYATAWANSWPQVLRGLLQSRYPVAGVTGGRGYLPASADLTTPTPPVTLAGAPSEGYNYGASGRYLVLDTAAKTATVVVSGTSVDLVYLQGGGGTAYYTIDGGAQVPFNTAGATLDGAVKNVALTAGSHSVVVGWSSGNPVYFEGFREYNGDEAKGVAVEQLGHVSWSVPNWQGLTSFQALAQLAPSLVVITLGTNDANTAGGNETAATFGTNLSALIAAIRAAFPTPPPILLHMLYDATAGYTPVGPWSGYVAAAKKIAAADSAIAFLDETLRMPATGAASTWGLYYSDKIHPIDKGHAMLAETIAAALAPAYPGT